jgi:[ribosomal protein S18]-alanine N-acetyltransferase
MTEYQIRRAGEVGEVVAASHLFDHAAKPEWAQRFLTSPGHHLLLAYLDDSADSPVGFVSGVEMTHPDKGTEMFLYELAVDEGHQNRGIGRALVKALGELARQQGCYDMWVLTDRDNPAALKTYQAGGATREDDNVMLTFNWSPAA